MSREELERLRKNIASAGIKLNDGGLEATDVCPVACILIKFDPG